MTAPWAQHEAQLSTQKWQWFDTKSDLIYGNEPVILSTTAYTLITIILRNNAYVIN